MGWGGGCLRSRVFLVLCVAIGLAPAGAFADWAEFAPRPYENGAFLDVYSSYERDHNSTAGAATTHWNDSFIREKVTVYSIGYSYHPRFLQYQLSVSGAARQEDYESSFAGSNGWSDGTGVEYDAKLLFLPEHPYNLEVFARRYEPLFKEQSASQHNSVETSQGASFRYRQRPYFVHSSVINDSIESGDTSSDVTRLGLDGQYFKRFSSGNEFSVNAAFNPSWFSNSQGIDGTSDEYLLSNLLNLQRARLSSSLTRTTFDQEGPSSEKFENDQLAWYELLNVYLPWNFRTDASYRYQKNDGTIHDLAADEDRSLSNTNKDVQLNLIHRLYESLDTTYTFLRDWRNYSGGDTTSTSNSLALNYTKVLPDQSRLLAGVNLARTDTDNSGQADVVNQSFPAIPVPGTITLPQQTVQPSSIIVFLKSPLPPFQFIQLQENVDYTLVPIANSFEIQVFNLPSEFVVPGTYDFFVSFELQTSNFELRTDTIGSNASVQLFEDLITPYASYVAVRSNVMSGVFPGVPLDSTTYTGGVILHRGPLRVRGEYQDFEWNVSPYRSWRVEAQYVWPLNESTSAYASAQYLNKYYPHGTSAYFPGQFSTTFPSAYTEETESAAASIQKQFFSRNMSVSAGGAYSRLHGLIDSDAYSLNAAWLWTIGKVDLSVGVTAYESDTSGTNTLSTRRDHQFVYVKLRRRLF